MPAAPNEGQAQWSFPYGWFEDLLTKELWPNWYDAVVNDNGFFHPQLDRQWRPYGEPFATLRSQTRLLYLFSAAYTHTGEDQYRQAVQRGADFLFTHFADRGRGGWYRTCGPDGTVQDETKDAYGHAFAVFGLAHAALATGDSAYASAAARTADTIEHRFADGFGGLSWVCTADFNDCDRIRSQNPIMHFTEALFALAEAEQNPARIDQARCWIDFLFSPGADQAVPLPEDYDLQWRPLAPDNGGRIVLGHQIEWAFLVSRGVELGLPWSYLQTGEALLDAGLRLGLDTERGGLYTIAVPGNGIRSERKGFWEQAETIRALVHYAVLRDRGAEAGLWEPLQRTVAFYRRFFHDGEYAGVYPGTYPDGTPIKTDKGSEGKLDYHTVGMCTEVLRLRDQVVS